MREIVFHDVRSVKADSPFLLDNGETAVLIDPGFGFTAYKTAENVKRILDSRELDYIFLTHSHYDHALATPKISENYPNAKVVAGSYAAKVFQREGAKRIMKELDHKYAVQCGVTEYEFLGDRLKADIEVNDGDIIQAGELKFQVLSLPGHTKCSTAFYCEDRKLMISSETLGVFDGNKLILPSYLVSYSATMESIDRVRELDIETMLMPHLGVIEGEKCRYFLENMKAAAERMAEEIIRDLSLNKPAEDIIAAYKEKYWHGRVREIYPIDALEMNTKIMAELIRREFLQ